MNKKDYALLLKRASLAYRLNAKDYSYLMDRATELLSDDEWERFQADLDEAVKIPLTKREIKQHEIELKKEAFRNILRAAAEANQNLINILKTHSELSGG